METITAASATGTDVILTNGYAIDFGFKAADAGFMWSSNGTVFKDEGGTLSQIHASTDWLVPVLDPGNYQLRIRGVTVDNNDAFQTGGSVDVDDWNTLDVTRIHKYRILDPELSSYSDTVTFYAEIRFGNGSNVTKNPLTSAYDAARIAATAYYEIDLVT